MTAGKTNRGARKRDDERGCARGEDDNNTCKKSFPA
jgi:hypothetical protein